MEPKYWLAYRCVDVKKTITYRRFDSKEECMKKMEMEVREDLMYIYLGYEDELEKMLQKMSKEERFFEWTYERKGEHVAWYILSGSENSFEDSVDINEYFLNWGND